MAAFQTTCPGCNATYKVEDSHLGRSARCAKCGARFKITTVTSGAAPSAPTNESASKAPSPAAAGPSEEANVPAQWNVGDVILDLYEVTGVLGEGGMGKVYKVHHRGWNLDLAVKCPKPDLFKTDRQKENFTAECETWIKLGLHPHIVSCHYVRTLSGIPRVFAECVEGGTLKDWIESGKLYEGGPEKVLERILDIAIQFAWGLHYAHEHEERLIHQDVKPANVMMTPDGIAKVTDFGLAKARAAAGEVSRGEKQQSILVSSGGMTPAYCSPEQANKEGLSRKTDIWSWGLSVLEMFTGDVTWMSGVAAPEALEGYLEMGAGDESIPTMPDALAELLRRCFRKNPDDRPKDMQEIADRLRELYQETTDEEYPREEPRAAELLADGLNNRGVSMLDLGQKEEACALWQEALAIDPLHPQSAYNCGLVHWRSSQTTDRELVATLEEIARAASTRDLPFRLLAQVHIERGDCDSAAKILGQAVDATPDIADLAERSFGPAPLAPALLSEKQVLGLDVPHNRVAVKCAGDEGVEIVDFAQDRIAQPIAGERVGVSDVEAAAFSPDGKAVLFVGRENHSIWSLETGEMLRKIGFALDLRDDAEKWPLNARSALLHSDGSIFIASYGPPHAVYVCEAGKSDFVPFLLGHAGRIHSLDMDVDGARLLTASEDGTARMWHTESGFCLHVYRNRGEPFPHAKFARGAPEVLICSRNGTVSRWGSGEGNRGRIREFVTRPNVVFCAASAHRASLMAAWCIAPSRESTAADAGSLCIWDTESGRCLRTISGLARVDRDWDAQLSFGPDDRCLFAFSRRAALKRWRLPRQLPTARFELCKPTSSGTVFEDKTAFHRCISRAKRELAEGQLGLAYAALRQAQAIPGYKYSPDARLLLRRLDSEQRRTGIHAFWCSRTMHSESRGAVNAVCFVAKDRALTGTFHGHLQLWDLRTGACMANLPGHADPIRAILPVPSSGRAATIDERHNARVWDLSIPECLACFLAKDYGNVFEQFAVREDGRQGFSVAGGDGYLWDLCLEELDSRFQFTAEGEVTLVAFHPRNSAEVQIRLANGSGFTLDLRTGTCTRVGSDDQIWEELSTKPLQLALEGDKVTVIAPRDSSRLARLPVGPAKALSADVNDRGDQVLAGDSAGNIRLWELDWELSFGGLSISGEREEAHIGTSFPDPEGT